MAASQPDAAAGSSLVPAALVATSAAALALMLRHKRRVRPVATEEPIESLDDPRLGSVAFGAQTRALLFRLDPRTIFVNHGSYGAVPRPVSNAVWQHHLLQEANPDLWFRKTMHETLDRALDEYAPMLNCEPVDLVFVTNATSGVHCVAESLQLGAGDAIFIPSTGYNAVNNILQKVCERAGASLIRHPVRLPVRSPEDLVAQVREGLEQHAKARVKFAVFDHVTSSTAMVCPVKELTALCKERGILVMVDGAHAIGHVDVDVTSIGCDFYTTNCHKWLFAPKGAALLYVARKHHSWIHAPVTSHDWKEDLHSRFATQGTRDFSSLVASRAALRFFQRISAARVRGYCRELREWAANLVAAEFPTPQPFVCPPSMHAHMALVNLGIADDQVVPMPRETALAGAVARRLYEGLDTVGVVVSLNGSLHTRVSATIYNTREDYVQFITVLKRVLFDEMRLKRLA